MVVKETESKPISKDVCKLLTELLQFEFTKYAFLISGKTYLHFHGLKSYETFFDDTIRKCSETKYRLIEILLAENNEIPEMSIPALTIDFEDAIDVFKQLAGFEEKAYGMFEQLVTKAFELNESKILAFALSVVEKEDHRCCRALEAVKNNTDPNRIDGFANDIPW